MIRWFGERERGHKKFKGRFKVDRWTIRYQDGERTVCERCSLFDICPGRIFRRQGKRRLHPVAESRPLVRIGKRAGEPSTEGADVRKRRRREPSSVAELRGKPLVVARVSLQNIAVDGLPKGVMWGRQVRLSER